MSDDRPTREDICGNAPAYVLGALPEDEHAAFIEHLSSCVVCREEVASLQVVVASLPGVVAQVAAPADLKRRVMGTVDREAREQAAATGQREQRPPRRTPRLAGSRPAFAAVGVAAVLAVLAVVVFSGGGGSSTHVFRAQVNAPHALAAVRVSGGHGQLSVSGMPQSPANHIYELWIKRTGDPQPTDVLFTVSKDGAATVGVPGSIKGVTEILVTAEPLGGSPVPTRSPIIVAPLS